MSAQGIFLERRKFKKQLSPPLDYTSTWRDIVQLLLGMACASLLVMYVRQHNHYQGECPDPGLLGVARAVFYFLSGIVFSVVLLFTESICANRARY
jgi:hypothetical protein